MTTNSVTLPASPEFSGWGSKLPMTEQRQRTERTTKQLTDQATKTYGRVLRKELKKLEKATA